MKKIKDAILSTIPISIAQQIYFIKNGNQTFSTNLINQTRFDLTVRKTDALWTKRLSTENGHEFGICKWLNDYMQPESVFFDVGACYGVFSALVANLFEDAEIHAFEPEIANFLFLKKNADDNQKKSRWTINRKFVSDTVSNLSITLDDYCKNNILPDVLKMDIDGGEYKALVGAQKLIAKKKTHFLIEIHPQFLKNYGYNYQQVLDLFDEDYEIFVLPNLRQGIYEWSNDLSKIKTDDNPYIYAAPRSISFFN